MSKTPNYDAAIKKILDQLVPGERVCALTGEKWLMTEEEIGWYKKFNVPPIKISPQTRWWVTSSWFFSFQWWWNKHAETGKPILSFVHPSTGLKVLPDKEWFDKDFSNQAREINTEALFFPQLRELQLTVPIRSEQNNKEPENSIARFSFGDINGFFNMGCATKDSFFNIGSYDIEETAETNVCTSVKNSFNIGYSQRIYNCKFVRSGFDCLDSAFLFDCRDCQYCFGATNKRHAKYIFFNQQLTKEEYESRVSIIDFSRRSIIDEYFKKFVDLMNNQTVWPENFNDQAENSSGEFLTKVSNNKFGFGNASAARDLFWVNYASGDCFDSAFCSGLFDSNDCVFCTNTLKSKNIKFSYHCSTSQNLEYCIDCYNCENCFGCVGLNRKKFHLLNKEYPEVDYWPKLDKLKTKMLERGEYGEFFPMSMATSYFPDSGAVLYLGAPKELGLKLGALDFEPESSGAVGEELSDVSKMKDTSLIPDNIDDLDEKQWLGIPLWDSSWKRRFAFIKPEIDFYRKNRLGPPRRHFIARMQSLFLEANIGKFEDQTCYNCQKQILVALNPTYKNRKIYCHNCYLKYLEENN
ncbi:TPA: hypothetical protein DEA21_05825 [Candidatus Uhrbacteria bacterium]|nr:hypothetical protein [Candidatus Uhrbacteria bacterium]